MTRAALAFLFCLFATTAFAQQSVTVIGPVTPGDCPQFSSTTVIKDGGFNCNGAPGLPPGTPANVLRVVTSNDTVLNTDCNKTLQLGTGATGFFTETIPNPTSPNVFPPTCVFTVVNGDTTRWKAVVGGSQTITCSDLNVIGPGQACQIGLVNGSWAVLARPGRFKPGASITLNFNTDFTNGTDVVGATDGLATGAAAFKSVEYCQLFAADQIDFNTESQTRAICNMAPTTTDTQGLHTPVHALVGAQGGAALQVVGASLPITGAVSNGGACEITVTGGTSSYSANQVISTYGIGGATGCNGTWKATVTNGTQLTLQGTTFGGSYTSGGTVTNGSSFNVSAADAVDCYFGTVLQFQNITFLSGNNGLGVLQGCKVYLQPGNIFAANSSSHIFGNAGGQIYVDGDIGIAASAGNSFTQIQKAGLLFSLGSFNINFVPGISPSFSGLAFAYSDNGGIANYSNLTINLNSNTVTGVRCVAKTLGLVDSGTGTPSSYFPGDSNCTTATGGQVN